MASFGWCVFAHVIMLSATCRVMVTAFLFCLSLFLKDTIDSLALAFILTLTNLNIFSVDGFLRTENRRRRRKDRQLLHVGMRLRLYKSGVEGKRRHLENELLV